MTRLFKLIAMLLLSLAPTLAAAAQDAPTEILFRNVRVFDGVGPALSPPTDVRVEGNVITRIAPRQNADGAAVIDGQDVVWPLAKRLGVKLHGAPISCSSRN